MSQRRRPNAVDAEEEAWRTLSEELGEALLDAEWPATIILSGQRQLS
jgi:hypothetical protein